MKINRRQEFNSNRAIHETNFDISKYNGEGSKENLQIKTIFYHDGNMDIYCLQTLNFTGFFK